MRGRYSDMARGDSTPSIPSAMARESEPKSTETEKSKPAKAFLKDFVDKIPTPIKDTASEQFGGMMGTG